MIVARRAFRPGLEEQKDQRLSHKKRFSYLCAVAVDVFVKLKGGDQPLYRLPS
jgi:hypothetical protein